MNSFSLDQVKLDFENTKKRVILAHTMKAQGFSRAAIEKAIKEMSQPDMVDLLIEELS